MSLGRVMPFFCRHSRSVANRPPGVPSALRSCDGVFVALAVALVEDELVEELPHAVSARLASTTERTAVAVGTSASADGLRH